MGSILVQLAVAAGAHVVAAARGARKLDAARALGAAAAVDYAQAGWTEQVREVTGGGPDVVFDGVGGAIGRAAFEITARGGRFSVHGVASGEPTFVDPQEARERGVRVLAIEQLFTFGPRMRGWAEQIMAAAAAGHVRPMIGRTFPLEQAAAAQAAIESRQALGKTVIAVN
ncbi:zinc-binding dehydrogenase [Streptodolium elevatio]